jgi:polysaccharide biosynthesis protein VpsM
MTMRNRTRFWERRAALTLALLAALSAPTWAQDDPSLFASDLAEGTRLSMSLQAGATYTSNFFYATSPREESATGLQVEPAATLTHVLPRFKFLVGADAEFGMFDLPGSVDDYEDYRIKLGSEWQPAMRHRFTFGSALRYDHDPFGTERTENTPLENREIDEWREPRMDVEYRWGLPHDRYNIEIRGFASDKEYSNNREVTQFLDHQLLNAQLLLFYNIGPKTSVFLNFADQRAYYPNVAPNAFDRGSNTLRYLVGARWLATAKTSGDVRIGYVDRNPRDPDRDDFQRLDWRADVAWSPRAVRELRLTTGRSSQESFLNTVDFINNRYVAVEWIEQWTPRFQSRLSGRYVDSQFVGSAREDDFIGFALGATYKATRGLSLLAFASNGERDSEIEFANYDRFYAYLGARYER